MRRHADPTPTIRLLPALALALTGCSFAVFDELADKAPVARVDQAGDISSANFGEHLVGLRLPAQGEGGRLGLTGNADPALGIVSISASGSVGKAFASPERIKKQLGEPTKFNAMVPANHIRTTGSLGGPFVHVSTFAGTAGQIQLVDLDTFSRVRNPYPMDQPPSTDITGAIVISEDIDDFGYSLAAAAIGDRSDDHKRDLAVGAKGKIVLLRATDDDGTLDDMEAVVVAADDAADAFTVLAAGDLLGNDGVDEIVAAAPETGHVFVIKDVAQCFADPSLPCDRFVPLEAQGCDPQLAKDCGGFGASLLVVNVDGQPGDELLVGDPIRNRVYFYRLEDGADPAPLSVIKGDLDEARSFGAALLYDKVAGRPHLVVGAPDTEVDGTENAGKLYLYKYSEDAFDSVTDVALNNPEEDTMLGRALALVPFSVDETTTDVLLAASGRDAVFIFFTGLTETHEDVRLR